MKTIRLTFRSIITIIGSTMLVMACVTADNMVQSSVGTIIEGDWDGDKKSETATAKITKKGSGNPIDGGTADEWAVQFSSKAISVLAGGCCDVILVNEGDLNSDGTDELSLYQAPMNGCTYTFTTYSYQQKAWKKIIETIMIPTGCDGWKAEDLSKRVIKEGNKIFIYENDFNDENFKLIKKEIELL